LNNGIGRTNKTSRKKRKALTHHEMVFFLSEAVLDVKTMMVFQ